MSEFWRLLLLVAIAGSAVTFMGSAAIWFMDEERRIRRALRHVLKGDPETVIIARGRGKGVGFTFDSNTAAVAWDSGAWCLLYRIDELMGAELSVDNQVIGRVFRGEQRRAIDQIVQQASRVCLRLIFDDPRHPDFELDLWLEGDEQQRQSRSPAQAIQEANRWLARAEAIVRRPLAPRTAPVVISPVPEPEVARRPAQAPAAEADKPKPYRSAREAVGAGATAVATAPLFDEIDDGPDAADPPWTDPEAPIQAWADDGDTADEPAYTPPERPYKPVSKASRAPKGDQVDLPFDLDDED
ncbi:hypothetical protein [Caulobacter hibisci]|uniref:Uncharacterized protein n=1 Tax=Caulobacter hibisci TaxID=2035993 RepID=A0ABS0T4B0_9CAUL|nr:hypothetical protein [Caulobacter hibisci]MBI1686726.1 hypothetical protein [Caulobacter hibisci]